MFEEDLPTTSCNVRRAGTVGEKVKRDTSKNFQLW